MATRKRRSTKGTRSKTHPGRKNYTTKKGDKVFHRKGKYVRKSRKPYSKKRMSTKGTRRRRSTKGTRSKTHPGRKNYTTKKGDKVFHHKGKYVRKSHKPYSKKKRGGPRVDGDMRDPLRGL